MKKIPFLVILFASFGCKTITVEKLPVDKVDIKGATYYLPKTELIFEISVKTTTYDKNPLGCYDDYKKYFKGVIAKKLITEIDKLKTDESYVTSKIASIVISPIPVADANKRFAITNKNKGTRKNIIGLNMDDNGVLVKGDFSSENMILPLVSQVISSAAGFVSPFSAARSAAPKADKVDDDFCEKLYNQYINIDQAEKQFSSMALLKNASELPSKDLYETVLTNFEKDKSSLFTQLMFSTDIQLDKAVIRFIPAEKNKDLINSAVLLGFKKGKDPKIYVNKTLIGSAYSFAVSSPGIEIVESDEGTITADKNLDIYRLSITPLNADEEAVTKLKAKPTDLKSGTPSGEEGGIYYNIPLNCKVYISKGTQNFADANIMMPQWGAVGRLSNRTSKQTVELNPLYGNLRSVNEESRSIDPSQVKSLGESLAAARDVFYTDPVTKMERRIKYLETKSKLTEAEGTDLSELRKQIDMLKAQKELEELKKALKELE